MTYYVIEHHADNSFFVLSSHATLDAANNAAANTQSSDEIFVAAHDCDSLYGWLSGREYHNLIVKEDFYTSAPRIKIKTKDGHIHMSDTELHRVMGYYPCGLLDVTSSGAVAVTAAKPEEIMRIYSTCRLQGLSVSKGLAELYRVVCPNGIM